VSRRGSSIPSSTPTSATPRRCSSTWPPRPGPRSPRASACSAAAAIGRRVAAGARLFTFGNGGSATDAELAADLFRRPPAGVPARSLVDDRAVLTALANDVGFELVFSRQLIAHARPGDIALGFSTSGGSANVLRAFAEARRRDMLTVAVVGYDGGALAAGGDVDHCLVVRSDSVHRIQEAQDALVHDLWARTRRGG